MHAFPTLASLALLLASCVHASVYVTNPVQSSSCAGGEACEVEWVDNGESPLLSQIGTCEVALYTGEFVLAQSLPSVDVSTTSSFSFTVDPAAGPDGQYYLVFTSDSVSYQGFSGSFTLSGMSGTTPGGGSSPAIITPASTQAGSSTSAGSTTPSLTDTATVSAPSGTSTPVVGTTTPTGSTSAVDTTATGTPSASATSPTTTPSSGTATGTTSGTTTTSRTSTSTSATASATATNAAGRVGSSTSLGGMAALFLLSGVLAF